VMIGDHKQLPAVVQQGEEESRVEEPALRAIGYTGKVSLEFEKNAENPTPGVAESIGYFRGICDATK